MSKRICPKCQEKLDSYDRYFCTKCGFELPSDVLMRGKSIVRVMKIEEPDKPKFQFKEHLFPVFTHFIHIINLKEIMLILSLAFVIGIPVYYWLRDFGSYINSSPGNNNLTEKESFKEHLVLDLDNGFKSHIFGASNIWDYVPDDVDVYVEGQDLKAASDLFTAFDPGYGPVFEKLVPVSDPHFGAYLKEYEGVSSWVILVFPYNSVPRTDDLDLSEFEWLKVESFGDVMIVSTKDVLAEVRDSKNSIRKNLGDNSQFKIYMSELPISGKLLMVTLNPAAKTYLKELLNEELPKEMKDILERYVESGFDNIVFK